MLISVIFIGIACIALGVAQILATLNMKALRYRINLLQKDASEARIAAEDAQGEVRRLRDTVEALLNKSKE